MPGFDSGFAPRVKAVLGPTNTGKTHLAIERMLAHASGIIGFPLRLLARENYDRMVAQKGARHVALITGEEKIVPPEARWFSCTVEAMPLDRQAEFLAVDEIQLCADPDRGHIFTDRLLHARGLVETMFLGAETIRPLLQRLVPQASVETRPRMSQLSHAGPVKLVRLPPRSAVVAFSAADVYAIAELIRRRRGGCAVVMGRLSPRTRNAQVALYQDKEVDFLVATDAIGMGLNMDVDHVAFASMGKFDGHRPRRLTAAEVAQIAGRAGRGMRDGTFGTTGQCKPLADDVVAAVEAHSFDALDQLCWRNSDLDLTHIDALLASLTVPPPGPGLVKGNDAADLETLAALAREPEIRRLAQGRRMVRHLWDACQIPDFRKLADDTHTRLCARVFGHIARGERLPTDWLGGQIGVIGAGGRRHRHADAAAGRCARVVLHRRAHRLGAGQSALAGPRARGRGPAVGRTARAADQPLRRPARGASDAPAGCGRETGTAVGRHPSRRGHRGGSSGRPCRRLQLRSGSRRGGRREEAGAARGATGAAGGDAAPGGCGGGRAVPGSR